MDKTSKTRHIFQALWFALTNGYVRGFMEGKIYQGGSKKLCVPGLNCYSCPGARFACPIGSLQAVLDSGQYKVSLYVLGCMAAFGVLLGRFVCGWLCPFGLVQDLLYKIPVGFIRRKEPAKNDRALAGRRAKRKNLPGHRYLIYLKYVILALFVVILPMTVTNFMGMGDPWFCKYICPSGTLLAGFPMLAMNEPLRGALGLLFSWKTLVLLVVIMLSVFYYRPFCKYLCPLGAFYGFFNKFAFYRLKVDEDKCIRCGKCRAVCGMDIKTWENPDSMECIRCGDCRSACPTGAITSTLEEMLEEVKRQA